MNGAPSDKTKIYALEAIQKLKDLSATYFDHFLGWKTCLTTKGAEARSYDINGRMGRR